MDALALVQTSDWKQIREIQRDAIVQHAKHLGSPLAILEAGCGRRWGVNLAGVEYSLTGVDLDPHALELRKTHIKDLDVAIHGDLCTVELPQESFDVVYSSFVLEHIERADIALVNLVKWLRPGGLLILHVPDPATVRGFFARMLPHRLHLWYYRYILFDKKAGTPGYQPYPTHYHPVIRHDQLPGFLSQHGVTCLGSYSDGWRKYGSSPFMNSAIQGAMNLVSICSLHKLAADYSDVLYVAVKQDANSLADPDAYLNRPRPVSREGIPTDSQSSLRA